MLTSAEKVSYIGSHEELVEVLIRLVDGNELSEYEKNLIVTSQPFGALESEFLSRYVDIVRQRVCDRLINLSQKNNQEPLTAVCMLDDLWQIWSQMVITPKLSEISLLSIEGKTYLRTIFATVVREFIGSASLILSFIEDDSVPLNSLERLFDIGLIEECNAVLASKVPQIIRNYVTENWKATYSQNSLKRIRSWVETELVKQLTEILKRHNSELPTELIMDVAIQELAQVRIEEIYKLVEDENDFGLNDLAQALSRCRSLREDTVKSYVIQCQKKLLNGASDTVDVIQMYLKTIKAFAVIDPQRVLLERASEPIRAELKERSDTSSRLAEGIFGEQSSPLAFLSEGLLGSPHTSLSPSTEGKSTLETRKGVNSLVFKCRELNQQYKSWQPDPIDAPTYISRKRPQDPVTTLINLYDNKEVFVQQFMKLFRNELLSAPFEDTEIIERLEKLNSVLGQRFGESNMSKPSIMLHDIRNSQFIAEKIHQMEPNLASISALVLSRLYWPSLPSVPELPLPEQFQKLADSYAEGFRSIPEFKDLDLIWLPDQGRVNVTLAMAERELTMIVRPHEALTISAFDDHALSLADLLEKTRLSEKVLLEAIQFWVDQSVLAPSGEKYKVLETLAEVEEHQNNGKSQVITSSDVRGTQKSAKDPFEEMHIYWGYIVGMLTNLGTLPVDKIHSFLVMLVPSESPYVKTKQELESYLLAMADEGKLIHDGLKFGLKK